MKFVLPGGTGQLGQVLAAHWAGQGHEVTLLTRSPRGQNELAWDGATLGPWASALDGADVVVNLAGRSVNCRYIAKNLRDMLDSRVDSTRVVGEAIAAAKRPPRVWLQASTATIYSHRHDAPNDDVSGVIGGDEPDVPISWGASVAIAKSWERELFLADCTQTRRVALRASVVLGPGQGSIYDVMATLAKRGLAGAAAGGRQFVSWIHERDFISALDFLIADGSLDGAVNVCSPNPLPNREFNGILRRSLGVRIGLPATRWMLEIGAAFMKTETELVLKSRRVVPTRLLGAGFTFDYPNWPDAAAALASEWKATPSLPASRPTPEAG